MTPNAILEFIKSSPHPVNKREIAQALRLKGVEQRVELKQFLKQLVKDGAISKLKGGAYSAPDGLPEVCILEVSAIDVDGDVLGKPVEWNVDVLGDPPRIEVTPDKKGHPALAVGDRALVRLTLGEDNTYEAKIIRRVDSEKGRVLGMVKKTRNGAFLQPVDKKARYDFEIAQNDLGGAQDGDIVLGEIQSERGLKRKKVKVVEVLGSQDDPKAISLISLSEMGLNEKFPAMVEKETEGMKVPDLKGREDLRDIPLVTIDGADARDFDDAVWAEKTDEGFHLIVAIADVAYYVRPGTALDREAQKRGNSTYFPDRVVPMLPEALSNDLCSLRPKENRACMAVHLYIDEAGELQRYKFVRGIMRSEARLTYEQVQFEKDAGKGEHLVLLEPLYEAYAVLDKARLKRGALELDLPERQILIDKDGNMTGVKMRERYDSHKLIEEFMILANVAAAKAIEAKRDAKQFPCVYRVHDRPSLEKLESVREFVEGFGLSLPKGQVTRPEQINMVLKKASEMPYSHLISQVILRSQAQAVYSAENVGHFGLALQRYAHFTSPIRRYADLLVHRALISGYGLGEGGLSEEECARIDEICQHISGTERTSMEAERNAIDRFTAAFLSEKIGAQFQGRISGVTRFGLFVTLSESGADGLAPIRSLPEDFYHHDEKAHALIGQRTGRVYRLGATVSVRLLEADGLTGSTILEITGESLRGADIVGMELKVKIPKDRRNDRSRKGHEFDKKRGKRGGKPPSGKRGKR